MRPLSNSPRPHFRPVHTNDDPSLVLWLPFYTGDANDKSGHGNNGTVTGATWGNGQYGNTLSFDGTNDYVSVGTPHSTAASAGSIALWFNPTSTFSSANATDMRIITEAGGYLYIDLDEVDGKMTFAFYDTGSKAVESTQTSWIGGQWYYAVATWESGVLNHLYIDATETGTPIAAGDLGSTAHTMTIGGRDTDYSFGGGIDDVRIYNRALSAQEIQNQYHSMRR